MKKLLLVDDDASLLRSIERNLCFDYEVLIAESGLTAIELLTQDPSIPVIVTDMKMPQMNGLKFIERARKISPESIYIMLTGNQDIDTAIAAVNDGSVFRFLNKPCPVGDIRQAIESALKQHDLVFAERELLQRTFVGAVNLLTDVVECLKPDLLDQSRCVDETMQQCESALGGAGTYEYRLAAKLGMVGFVLLPQSEQDELRSRRPDDPIGRDIFNKMVRSTSRLVGRIPRLGRIAELFDAVPDSDGSALCGEVDLQALDAGAALFKLSVYWTIMNQGEVPPKEAIKLLRSTMSKLPDVIDGVLGEVEDEVEDEVENQSDVCLKLSQLLPEMVFRNDVTNASGATLIRAGVPLTEAMIEKLKFHERSLAEVKFEVAANSLVKVD